MEVNLKTSFKDKNSKQIRLGDILKYDDCLYVVKYGNYEYDGVERIGFFLERKESTLVQLPQIKLDEIISSNSEKLV